jgi:hypothetical protein
VDLVLYVNAHATSSRRARDVLAGVLRQFPADRVRLDVRDVALEPLRAEEDGVLFAPTLVKTAPSPRAWIVGDLGDGSAVTALLNATGLEGTG